MYILDIVDGRGNGGSSSLVSLLPPLVAAGLKRRNCIAAAAAVAPIGPIGPQHTPHPPKSVTILVGAQRAQWTN